MTSSSRATNYVLAGYGSRSTTPANGIDVVIYRFTAAGVWDRTFGDDGLFTYNRVNGADRARDLTSLPDGRLVTAGSTANADNTDVDGLILVVSPDGKTVDQALRRRPRRHRRLVLRLDDRVQRHEGRRRGLPRGHQHQRRRGRADPRRPAARGRRPAGPAGGDGPGRPCR